ncbi:MAG: SDR family oxidoreductase [Anaerolineae bacterium]|jgi:uncharacterized protein YbjT (DUF2867 family)|nr:SDR family oxidoreductase [Anaerolineae bacterium]
MTILITGATGNVGYEVAKGLPGARIAARDPERARAQLGDAYDYVPFDFMQPWTFTPALSGVERLFLIRPPQIVQTQAIEALIEAAQAAGVSQIVFLSLIGVEQRRYVPHYRIEALIRSSGIPATMLRAGFFMQNLNTTHRDEIRDQHQLAIPAGQSRTAFIDVRDIAKVAIRALTEPGHADKTYDLTGSEALSYTEIATILSEVLGTPIRYTNPSIWQFVRDQRTFGRPWPFTIVMTLLYTLTRFGMAAQIAPDTERLLGRAPITFRQYAQDYKRCWI